MDLGDVKEIVGSLAASGVAVWVDGGWCVEALVGREVRQHGDLDLAVRRSAESSLREWLASHGFRDERRPGDSPWNYVQRDDQGRRLDIHVFEFDEDENLTYGVAYPAESLTGRAVLGGLPIHCIAPEWMFRFKTAYAPAPKDILDVHALADKFGYAVPTSHRGGPWTQT